MIEHPELPLGGIQQFDLDIERGDEWPMPPHRPWLLRRLSLNELCSNAMERIEQEEEPERLRHLLVSMCSDHWHGLQLEEFSRVSVVANARKHQHDYNMLLREAMIWQEREQPAAPPKTNLFMRVIFGIFK